MSLIDNGVGGVQVRPTRHRADATVTDRFKVVAGSAVAAGALLGAVAQVAPAIANAAPLLPSDDAEEAAGPITFKGVEDLQAAAARTAVAAPVVEEATAPQPVVTQVAAPIADGIGNPFGIAGLPPELAGPLAQVEQMLKNAQPQVPQIAMPAAPAVRPVAGEISSGFGHRWGSMHYGVDFADRLGAPIHSVSGGTVVEAGPASGFGLWVRVLQDDGTTAVYGHVNDMFVQEGQRVNAGDVIASVGNRGQSTGPHLHLEIWDQGGSKIDPLPYLSARGIPMQWGPSDH